MKKNGELRERDLPTESLSVGVALMEEQDRVTRRYLDWARDTVNAMKLGEPKEGHQWVVDPRNRKVREQPISPSPASQST